MSWSDEVCISCVIGLLWFPRSFCFSIHQSHKTFTLNSSGGSKVAKDTKYVKLDFGEIILNQIKFVLNGNQVSTGSNVQPYDHLEAELTSEFVILITENGWKCLTLDQDARQIVLFVFVRKY